MTVDFLIASYTTLTILALALVFLAILIFSWIIRKFPGKDKFFLEDLYEKAQLIRGTDLLDHIDQVFYTKIRSKLLKNLCSPFSRWKRLQAASLLKFLPEEKSGKEILRVFQKEKNPIARFYLANALVDLGYNEAIPVLIDSLKNSSDWYFEKVKVILPVFSIFLYQHLSSRLEDKDKRIQSFIIHFASLFPHRRLKIFLIGKCRSRDKDLVIQAAGSLFKLYPEILQNDFFLENENKTLRHLAIQSYARKAKLENIFLLLPFLAREQDRQLTVNCLSEITSRNHQLLMNILGLFHNETDMAIKEALAEVLEKRLDYFMQHAKSGGNGAVSDLLLQLLLKKRSVAIIAFLNKNKDRELETVILHVLRKAVLLNADLEDLIKKDLCPRLRKKLGWKIVEEQNSGRQKMKEASKNIFVLSSLILLLVIFSAVFFLFNQDFLFSREVKGLNILKKLILDYNHFLIYYFLVINFVYLVLLFFSWKGSLKQSRNWKLKDKGLLFKAGLLPSISILLPAFNEEKNIIESINSLLALDYPDYQLIIVNDGSSDNTLETVIRAFNLKKRDLHYNPQIHTKAIQFFYNNPEFPKLLLLDKENGGKADSINAGINLAKKDYICVIDADSVLEQDSLLKITSFVLDTEKEAVACGGNIIPVNGCLMKKGRIIQKHLPQKSIARFQTAEYLRSFMTGRTGWANLGSLLIISGAFGLFKKSRVLEIGGFLSSSGLYKRDTVGEDMEMVVRLKRHLLEKNYNHHIHYAYDANCWTEVPESLVELYKQRERWQRGLIDIIAFHKKMLFNPFYRNTGLFALPYFYLFEIIGPLIECSGYLCIILAFFLGFLSWQLALLLFASSIGFGLIISCIAFIIFNRQAGFSSFKSNLILLGTVILENFGFRQLMNIFRFSGFFRSFGKGRGWLIQKRKGFENKKTERGSDAL